MQNFSRNASAVITLAAALVLAPSNATAQDVEGQDPEPQECTARISPAQVAAGLSATKVTIVLSEDIGAVTGVQKSTDAKRITVALPADVPRLLTQPLDAERPAAVARGLNDTSWTLWLNTSQAAEGMQLLTFVAGENVCAGELEVTPAN